MITAPNTQDIKLIQKNSTTSKVQTPQVKEPIVIEIDDEWIAKLKQNDHN